MTRPTNEAGWLATEQIDKIRLNAYLTWLRDNADATEHEFPYPIFITGAGWIVDDSGDSGSAEPALTTVAAGNAHVNLRIAQGRRLDNLILSMIGDDVVTVTLNIEQIFTSDIAPVVLKTLSAPGVPSAWNLYTVFMHTSMAGEITTNVSFGAGHYTRTVGDFEVDGFYVGQEVTFEGFVNPGNNGMKVVTGLAPTFLTTSSVGIVGEVATVTADGVCPAVSDTFRLGLRLHSDGTGAAHAKSLRYKHFMP